MAKYTIEFETCGDNLLTGEARQDLCDLIESTLEIGFMAVASIECTGPKHICSGCPSHGTDIKCSTDQCLLFCKEKGDL